MPCSIAKMLPSRALRRGGEGGRAAPRYAAQMTRRAPEARGTREFSSPEVRVRSDRQPPFHARQRLLLPRERRRRERLNRALRIFLPLILLAGIGVGVYFGVYYLLRDDGDEPAPTETAQAAAQGETAAEPAAESTAETAVASEAQASPAAQQAEPTAAATERQSAPDEPAASEEPAQPAEPQTPAEPETHPARVEPSVSEETITPASVSGAPLLGERMTAEALPAGIPRQLADESPYDPTDPAAAFSNLWPVGTTLRLTRLPGAPLLNEEQAAQVVGAEALVVIRGSENSNTDIQLSAAAFELLGFYETERIIAVRAEVAAPPP